MNRTIFLPFTLIIFVSSIQAQNINTPENFPDPNFRAVVEEFMGVAAGGEFTAADVAGKTDWFDCSGSEIADLKGIEYFERIGGLICSNNNLTELDVSSNTALTYLEFLTNQILGFDVTMLTNLEVLKCGFNPLTEVNLTQNTELFELDCRYTNITEIDLSKNPKLKTTILNSNKLNDIDFSNNPLLEFIWLNNNQLTEIHPSILNLDNLRVLNVRNNNLSCDDWEAIQQLRSTLGDTTESRDVDIVDGFAFSPQNGFNPFDCNLIEVAYNPSNSHYYAVFDDVVLWDEARQLIQDLFDGSGYLATVTSDSENSFLVDTFGWDRINQHWLGGFQSADFPEESSEAYSMGWQWVTGEEWNYTNWAEGEPNNASEDHLQYFVPGADGTWNDLFDTRERIKGYIVEWDQKPSDEVVIINPDALPPITISRNTKLIQWAENGHYYQAFYYPLSKNEANQVAESLYNRQGYLATISSPEEFEFIKSTYLESSSEVLSIGGSNEDNQWRWVNGEVWSDQYWCSGYPQQDGSRFLTMSSCGFQNSTENTGILIEWDSNPYLPPITESDNPTDEEKALSDLYRIGQAIEQLYLDQGIQLVDFVEQETPEGMARLENQLENVGNPTDRERTARDILQPLVHFGYLDSIPDDPFSLSESDSRIDTYLYMANELELNGLSVRIRYPFTNGHWSILSPGSNGDFGSRSEFRNPTTIEVTRIDVLSVEPLLSITKGRVENELKEIGKAIQQLYEDTGVLLVDHWDDDTAIGRNRLANELLNVGNVSEIERRSHHLLDPLLEFGYLESIPFDPYAREITNLSSQTDAYFYMDNDPAIPDLDYYRQEQCCALRLLDIDPGLEPGDWMLISAGPHTIPFSLLVEGVSISLRSNEIEEDGTDIGEWMMY